MVVPHGGVCCGKYGGGDGGGCDSGVVGGGARISGDSGDSTGGVTLISLNHTPEDSTFSPYRAERTMTARH